MVKSTFSIQCADHTRKSVKFSKWQVMARDIGIGHTKSHQKSQTYAFCSSTSVLCWPFHGIINIQNGSFFCMAGYMRHTASAYRLLLLFCKFLYSTRIICEQNIHLQFAEAMLMPKYGHIYFVKLLMFFCETFSFSFIRRLFTEHTWSHLGRGEIEARHRAFCKQRIGVPSPKLASYISLTIHSTHTTHTFNINGDLNRF